MRMTNEGKLIISFLKFYFFYFSFKGCFKIKLKNFMLITLFFVLFSASVLGDFSASSEYSKFELCKGETFTDTITIENNNPEQIVIDISQENEDLYPFTSIVPDEVIIEPYGQAQIYHIIRARKDADEEYKSELLFEYGEVKKVLNQEIEFLVCDNFQIETIQKGYSNCPCVSTIYYFEIQNTGRFEDTFDLSMDINEGFYNLSDDSISLEPGMEKTFYADIRKSCDIRGDFHINLLTESRASGLKKTEDLFLNLRDDCYGFDFHLGNITKDLTKDFIAKDNHTYELEINETVYIPFSITNTGEFNNSYNVNAKKPDFMELGWINKTQRINETAYGYIKANTTSVKDPDFDVIINVSSNVGYHEAQYTFNGIVKDVERPLEGFLDNLYRYLAYLGLFIVILLLVAGIIVYLVLRRKEYPFASKKDKKEDTSKESYGDSNSFSSDLSVIDEPKTSVTQEKTQKQKKESKTKSALSKEKNSGGLSGGFIALIIGIIVLALLLLGLAVFLLWPSVYQEPLGDYIHNKTPVELFENITDNETKEFKDVIENVTVDINKTEDEPYISPIDDVNITEAKNKTATSKISDFLTDAGNFVLNNYFYFIIGLFVLLLLVVAFIFKQKIKSIFMRIFRNKKTVGFILIITGILLILFLISFYYTLPEDKDTQQFGKIEDPSLEKLQSIHPELTEANITHYIWSKEKNKTIDFGEGIDSKNWENITYYPREIENISVDVNGSELTFFPDKCWQGNRLIDLVVRDEQGQVVYNTAFVLVVLEGEEDSYLLKETQNFILNNFIYLILIGIFLIVAVVFLIIYSRKKDIKNNKSETKAIKDKSKGPAKKTGKKTTNSGNKSKKKVAKNKITKKNEPKSVVSSNLNDKEKKEATSSDKSSKDSVNDLSEESKNDTSDDKNDKSRSAS